MNKRHAILLVLLGWLIGAFLPPGKLVASVRSKAA